MAATMYELYGLPSDFPEFQRAVQIIEPDERASILQDGLASDIDDWRLIPYLQLHEFEALLLFKPVGTQFGNLEGHGAVLIDSEDGILV